MSAFSPSLEEALAALRGAEAGGKAELLVPVFTELIADLETPVSAFLKLRGFSPRGDLPAVPVTPLRGAAAAGPAKSEAAARATKHTYAFLLESVEGGERLARYSIVGFAPHGILTVGAAGGGGLQGDPLTHVEAWLAKQHLVTPPSVRQLPAFCGGAVGYVAYDAVRHFEPRTAPAICAQEDALGIPEAVFMLCDDLLLFDHVRHTIKVLSHLRLPNPRVATAAAAAAAAAAGSDGGDVVSAAAVSEAYAAACGRIDAICARLAGPLPRAFGSEEGHAPHAPGSPEPVRRGGGRDHGHAGTALHVLPAAGSAAAAGSATDLEGGSNMGRAGYEAAVVSLKGHIVEGDIIQAVPSHRVTRVLPAGVSAFDVYRHLRVVNPSPYMFFLDLGPAFQIVGASPEMLVKVTAGGEVQTHPIAGTRRRGATPEEDDALAAELLADEKERAEHVMLVDLGRNDIGRVAAPGSVRVSSLMHIERYSHVQHIVSTVTGRLAPGRTAFDAFRSVFPAGTVSGAPKVRAVELVAGLEAERRGVYAGSVGYVAYSGVMDTAIAIRTLVVRDGDRAFLQAGAGIVHDSVPASEYEETIAKMRGVERAIQSACTAAARAAAASTTAAGTTDR